MRHPMIIEDKTEEAALVKNTSTSPPKQDDVQGQEVNFTVCSRDAIHRPGDPQGGLHPLGSAVREGRGSAGRCATG